MKHRRYDESFKSEAVKLALSCELSYAEVARDLGVNYATLSHWIYSTMNQPKQCQPSNTSKPSKQDYQALERQFKAAHKELDLRKREMSNVQLDASISNLYEEHQGRYGYRLICEELREMGIASSLERVRRRIRCLGLLASRLASLNTPLTAVITSPSRPTCWENTLPPLRRM